MFLCIRVGVCLCLCFFYACTVAMNVRLVMDAAIIVAVCGIAKQLLMKAHMCTYLLINRRDAKADK